MECSDPGALRDEDLMAYLDGVQVRPQVAAHCMHCPRCSQLIASYRELGDMLTGKLYRWDCPSSQVLGEYQLGMLNDKEVAHIQQHAAWCVLCSAELSTLSSFLEHDPMLVGQTWAVPDVAAVPLATNNHHGVVAGARHVIEQLQDQVLAGARYIVATLLPSSPQLISQQRGVVTSWPRQYEAKDVLISLQIEDDPHPHDAAQMQLLGLVTCTGGTLASLQGVSVILRAVVHQEAGMEPRQSAVYTQQIDDLGNFLFPALALATYTLELHMPQGVVVIEQLDLSAQE